MSEHDDQFGGSSMQVPQEALDAERRSYAPAPATPPEATAPECSLCGEPDDDMNHVTISADEGEPGRACIKGQGWRPATPPEAAP